MDSIIKRKHNTLGIEKNNYCKDIKVLPFENSTLRYDLSFRDLITHHQPNHPTSEKRFIKLNSKAEKFRSETRFRRQPNLVDMSKTHQGPHFHHNEVYHPKKDPMNSSLLFK